MQSCLRHKIKKEQLTNVKSTLVQKIFLEIFYEKKKVKKDNFFDNF